MKKSAILLAFAAVAALGACKKTGEGEVEVKSPTVDVGTKTDTVLTPTVDVGTKEDTLVVKRPTVDVDAPGNKTPDDKKTGTGAAKRP
jgi:hypothetical protein